MQRTDWQLSEGRWLGGWTKKAKGLSKGKKPHRQPCRWICKFHAYFLRLTSFFFLLSCFLVFKNFLLNLLGWQWLIKLLIKLSGVQFYNTSSAYCIVCSPPQLTSPSIPIYPPIASSTSLTAFPSGNHHPVVSAVSFCLIPSPVSPSPPTIFPLTAVGLFSGSMSLFLFCLLVYSVH